MNENRNKPPENKNLWADEDWDNYSKFHKWHKDFYGVSLDKSIQRFYIAIIIGSILACMFTRY